MAARSRSTWICSIGRPVVCSTLTPVAPGIFSQDSPISAASAFSTSKVVAEHFHGDVTYARRKSARSPAAGSVGVNSLAVARQLFQRCADCRQQLFAAAL